MPFDLLVVLLVGLTVTLVVVGLSSLAVRRKALLASRVSTYAAIEAEAAAGAQGDIAGWQTHKAGLPVPFLEKLALDLNQADLPWRPLEYLLLQVGLAGAGVIIGLQLLGYMHSALILGVAGFGAPMVMLRLRQHSRRMKFARQLADALMLLSSSLRSGYGFIKGLELVAAEMDDPMAKELKRALREIQLGSAVDQALLALSKRVGNADMEIVICAYLIQREVGGNLTELMEKVAETIRERFRIRADIRTLTAQGRLSGIEVSLLPLVLTGLIILTNPAYFQPLFQPPLAQLGPWLVPVGAVAIVLAIVLQITGAAWIYRIISIKV